ncbi:hypothetical protein Q0M94_06885 [Deinococcus radiomollis]|uniref:hypothetical protein n=1 Tax=Deinococcus radiomollis TaxID=468916 RepID=UPI00389297AC
MLNDETARHLSADIASHLSEARRLARILHDEHQHGERLYRELERTCLPPEYADPTGEVDYILERSGQS